MAHILEQPSIQDLPRIDVHRVRNAHVLQWLHAGHADVRRSGLTSLGYGALVAGFGLGLLVVGAQASYLVPALIGGFMLVAPFAAIVLYALSRQLEESDETDSLVAAFEWRHNAGSIALFGLMLALALIGWERISAIVFALFYGGTVPDLEHLASDMFFSGRYVELTVAWFACGALFAAVVFVFTVVSAPLLLDQPVDVVTAALTSLRCCRLNPGPMALWAVVLALCTVVGFCTLMLGLIYIFPLLGHASWHAYRDMVEVRQEL